MPLISFRTTGSWQNDMAVAVPDAESASSPDGQAVGAPVESKKKRGRWTKSQTSLMHDDEVSPAIVSASKSISALAAKAFQPLNDAKKDVNTSFGKPDVAAIYGFLLDLLDI